MNRRKTLPANIQDMGLVFDVNKSLGIPNYKSDRTKKTKLSNGFVEENQTSSDEDEEATSEPSKRYEVVDKLEEGAKALRESKFRLPKGIVEFVSYLIDKYGLDYKKMAKDRKNYDQETWRQLRAKCRKFMSIPEQFSKFLVQRDLVETEIDPNDPKWQENNTDIDDD